MRNSTLEVSSIPPSALDDAIIVAPDEVQPYLREHPKLAALLPAICSSARAEFGNSAQLTLQVYHDPEIEDHYLALIVRLPVYDRATMKRIDRIWEKFESELTDSPGWLTITTDFRIVKANNGI
jgi:hypothetical protein